jgi:tetratricopeptide (TPR) repeat protein
MRRIVAVLAALAPAIAVADDPPGRTVQDLAYGEVLFEYFQDDHLAALTRLLAGLERNELPHHARDADLMLGALYLSFGQHRVAGEVFGQVLAETVDPELHDRAWFFLAKIWYQRGYLEEASAALARIQGALPEEFEPERMMLQAEVLMAEQRFADALAVLEAWDDPDPEWAGFVRYNVGVSLVRLGDVTGGARVLAELGQIVTDVTTSETLLALRDKANVALGYAWLQAGQPVAAKPALQRVRLTGPYSNKALLGVGWADAEQNDFRAALAPWVELGDRDLLDSAVQESLLAVPYAFARLEADGQAAEHYQGAIDAFAAEIGRIDGAIDSVASGALLGDWLAQEDTTGSGWYFELGTIPDTTESRYLTELMASNSFQEGVKNYRDLLAMSQNLDQWDQSLVAFDDILATRQAAFAGKAPAIAASVGSIDLDAIEQRRVELESRLLAIEQTEDVVALGTPDQQRIWRELEAMAPDLARIEGQPEAAAIAGKHRLFQGLVLWDLRRDYRARLWSEQRSLRELDLALKEARRRQNDVSAGVEGWEENFANLSADIGGLRPRVAALKAATDAALARQRAHLDAVAIDVLNAQRDRLDTYMVQARFSLASIYDRSAARVGPVASGAVLAGDGP